MRWNSSSHPISDLRDWNTLKRLEITPDYQRREVWSEPAKVMLMDSIIRNIPIPKVFFQAIIRENNTYRIVIDGQQRIKAILSFLNGDFKLTEPLGEEYIGKNFNDLSEETRHAFLSYKIDINEIIDATDEVVREIYSRVNKYTVALSKQELRRADFPGDYLRLSEELAINEYLEEVNIFSVPNRRRLSDVEYTSELIAILVSRIQDKKNTLDSFYQEYASWDSTNLEETKQRFIAILFDLNILFEEHHISKTRFKQKADFYSLFAAINELHKEGFTIKEKETSNLQKDLITLDAHIAPESSVSILSEYAIKCVSQANSFSSRQWRKELLKNILSGTYVGDIPSTDTRLIYHEILGDIYYGNGFSPLQVECAICKNLIKDFSPEIVFLTWLKGEKNYQLENTYFIHNSCKEKASEDYYSFIEEQ